VQKLFFFFWNRENLEAKNWMLKRVLLLISSASFIALNLQLDYSNLLPKMWERIGIKADFFCRKLGSFAHRRVIPFLADLNWEWHQHDVIGHGDGLTVLAQIANFTPSWFFYFWHSHYLKHNEILVVTMQNTIIDSKINKKIELFK
jgi:hypothetical protein